MLLFEMSCMTLREATEADVGYFLFCECTAVLLLLFWLLVVRDVDGTEEEEALPVLEWKLMFGV